MKRGKGHAIARSTMQRERKGEQKGKRETSPKAIPPTPRTSKEKKEKQGKKKGKRGDRCTR